MVDTSVNSCLDGKGLAWVLRSQMPRQMGVNAEKVLQVLAQLPCFVVRRRPSQNTLQRLG